MQLEKKYKRLINFIKIFNKFEDKNDIVEISDNEELLLIEFMNTIKNENLYIKPINVNDLTVLGIFDENNNLIDYNIDYLEWCTFKYLDYNNNIIENFNSFGYDELTAFNEHNIAPYTAEKIGVFYRNELIGFIELGNLKKEFNERLYRVGLMSDMHYNDTSVDMDPETIENYDGSEYEEDLTNALSYYQNNEEISFMCAAGDISTDSKEHLRNFALNLKTKAPDTPLYSCLGNHDFQATHYETTDLHDDKEFGLTEEFLSRIGIWNEHITPKDDTIHFFDDTTEEGKLSYYIERNVPETNKTDIYLFLSVDYGVTHATKENKANWEIQAAQKMLDYNESNVQELMNYVGSIERSEIQQQYDYQFYNSDVLLWVKNIIESNQNRRIFLFTHQFFTQKAGNNNSGQYYSYVADYWRISQRDDESGQIAYCLCGLQFEFMNKLNNDYHNVIWFTGHSHYSWKWQIVDNTINICNNEYDIYDPNKNDFIKELRYLRKDSNIILKSGYNVHLPSLTRPIPYYVNQYEVSLKESEGAIMDIYENYVDIRGLIFKGNNDNAHANKYYPLAQYRIYVPAGE